MKHFNTVHFSYLQSRFKANLINSCSGYRSSNLLATCNEKGESNLAIFNSIVHIGSNPPMLGFVLRPLTVRRDTYDNFKATGYFTVNQVSKNNFKQAHQTAAKYDKGVSEFAKTGLSEEYLDDFKAPYVKESTIKIGCSYENEYEIKENGCILIIGKIEHLYLPEEIIHKDGWVQLDKADTVTSIGLDGYALPKILDRLSYAKPDQETRSVLDGL
ncbi:flavin oxidoreductase [Maribacter sp. 4U21]|uniref:flavin reductase family protein n=1 Tax=Maribacter sp. 4U21 TaxID=1889779 RepID=UPI000C148272|nr:flavin reductase family protein [Maribacter sp. 4U21]PIB22927.1 flavin oxidoreductase [Maribacter sp. 4U21]